MRCPDCNKFVAYEEEEPEIDDENPEFGPTDTGVSFNVVIKNTCADCGTELKEASFDPEVQFESDILEAHRGEGHELSVEVADASREQDSEPKPKLVKDRKTGEMKMKYPNPRFTKTLYGFQATVFLYCRCKGEGGDAVESITVDDFISASSMDELV